MKKNIQKSSILTTPAKLSGVSVCNFSTPHNKSFVRSDGIRILDQNGNPFGLMGTNLGGWLVQEQWLCPTATGKEIADLDIYLTLYNRFGAEKAEALLDAHQDNWVTEQDFAHIKDLGFNCVRIPFSYMNFMNPLIYDEASSSWVVNDYKNLSLKDNPFARLDWAMEMCKKYELYAILDMHGAVGSQSGQDHSGDISEKLGRLWRKDNIGKICRQKTKELWVAIAERYKDNPWVAMYDLLNEPGVASINKKGEKSQKTNKQVWNYYDELVKAVRKVDPYHLISVESCWEAKDLPKPSRYGWTNVIYQYHHYNWAKTNTLNSSFYTSKVKSIDISTKRDYPVLVGEFNVWADSNHEKTKYNKTSTQTEAEAWSGVVELYAGKGWSFTTWNFKHASNNSTWGIYNFNEGATPHRQANIFIDSAEDISEIWASHNSKNYQENTFLTSCIKPYFDKFYIGEDVKPLDEKYYILNNLDN